MFRNARGGGRDTLLPTAGGGRNGGAGLYGSMRSQHRAGVSKSFLATVAWAMVSLSLVGGGWRYCSRRLELTTVKCDPDGCKVTQIKGGEESLLTIPRDLMVRGELVRIKNGEIADPSTLRRSAQRKLGHSFAVVYLAPDSTDTDDDEYDSFADDDDSYDSYDDSHDSSEDDDDDDDKDSRRAAASGDKTKGKTAAAKKTVDKGDKNKVKGSASSKAFGNRAPRTDEEKAAEEEKRKELREVRAATRKDMRMPPLKEPDEAARTEGQVKNDEDRFPGDAGTMLDGKTAEVRKPQGSQTADSKAHQERHQEESKELSKKRKENDDRDMLVKQMGNNLHDRAPKTNSPDDPDNNPPLQRNNNARPGLDRQAANKDLSGAPGVDARVTDDAERIKDLQAEISRLQGKDTPKSGGRTTSSVGGLEDVEQEEDEENADLMFPEARGGARKLLTWKRPVRKVEAKPPTRSKADISKDAQKAREEHRMHRGHHQKRRKKVAQTVEDDDGEGGGKVEKKATHHHKAFHHKEAVPDEERHHEHRGFHHLEGEEKIPGGWRHQHREWHERQELKQLGTSYSLGRGKARKRKELIDSYAKKDIDEVEFTDAKKWRAGGLWMMILGCISSAFCTIVGNFQPRPKTKKVS